MNKNERGGGVKENRRESRTGLINYLALSLIQRIRLGLSVQYICVCVCVSQTRPQNQGTQEVDIMTKSVKRLLIYKNGVFQEKVIYICMESFKGRVIYV